MYGIRNPVGGVNEVAARPRTVESCRGDNPWAVVVDEIAFVKKDWFYRFLQPLTQVRERRFTCEFSHLLYSIFHLHGSFQTPTFRFRRHHNAPARGNMVLRGHRHDQVGRPPGGGGRGGSTTGMQPHATPKRKKCIGGKMSPLKKYVSRTDSQKIKTRSQLRNFFLPEEKILVALCRLFFIQNFSQPRR